MSGSAARESRARLNSLMYFRRTRASRGAESPRSPGTGGDGWRFLLTELLPTLRGKSPFAAALAKAVAGSGLSAPTGREGALPRGPHLRARARRRRVQLQLDAGAAVALDWLEAGGAWDVSRERVVGPCVAPSPRALARLCAASRAAPMRDDGDPRGRSKALLSQLLRELPAPAGKAWSPTQPQELPRRARSSLSDSPFPRRQ